MQQNKDPMVLNLGFDWKVSFRSWVYKPCVIYIIFRSKTNQKYISIYASTSRSKINQNTYLRCIKLKIK